VDVSEFYRFNLHSDKIKPAENSFLDGLAVGLYLLNG
jgi:hypothetical protein